MGWNQPTTNGPTGKRRNASNNPRGAGIAVAIVFTIATAGLFVFLYSGGGQDAEQDTGEVARKSKSMQEFHPAFSAPRPVNKQKESVKPNPNARPTKVGEVVNGYVLLPSGRMHKCTGVITNTPAMRPKGKYAIFARKTDNEIAAYLSLKPGDTIVGTPRYNGRFERDFLDSLKEPILITNEDTPEQVELKNAVIAARKDLKDAYDRGESIEQIMLDTRAELQMMMRYKNELKHEFNKLRKGENITDQDVEDLFDACNLMLDEKGIAPMKFGPITRRRMRLAAEKDSE